MDVGFENDNSGNMNEVLIKTSAENEGMKETIEGINFGIIDIPDMHVAFDKVASNIKVINAQGNVIINGNPATQNLKYVSDLDKGKHLTNGSNYVKAEISEEELYGSELQLTYQITARNDSDVNFYEKDKDGNKLKDDSKYYGYYYKFGIKNPTPNVKTTEVTIQIDEVLDMLDPKIIDRDKNIVNSNKTLTTLTVDEMDLTKADNVYKDIIENAQAKSGLTYDTAFKITDWIPLYSTKGNRDDENNTQDTAQYTAIRLLSTQEEDLGVSNIAEVVKIHLTDEPELIDPNDPEIPDPVFDEPDYPDPTPEVITIITPPTGADTMTIIIYIVTGLVGLGVISAGIVLIKKKVLK